MEQTVNYIENYNYVINTVVLIENKSRCNKLAVARKVCGWWMGNYWIQFVVALDKINGHYRLANVTITATHTSFSLYSQHNII